MGGGEKYMLTAALCLASRHQVSIFCSHSEQEIKSKARNKFGMDLGSIEFVKNIFSTNTPLFSRLFLANSYDLIIFLSDGSIPLIFGKKLVIHFQFPVEWVNFSLKTKFKLSKVKKIICNSFFTKRYIDKKFNIQSLVLYPPVELSSKKAIKKKNIVLNVGRFGNNNQGSSFKKQEVMVSVFKEMIKRGLKNWEFVLIVSTREEDKEGLKKLKNGALGFPIKFVENPKNPTLWEVYREAKIYWHAAGFGEDLQKHPERAEHFGIATVEAMGAGCVPVVFNAGGQKEIVEDGKSGFLWNTEKELIKKTNLLIENPNLWEEMSVEAIEKAKVFNRERFCKELTSILK